MGIKDELKNSDKKKKKVGIKEDLGSWTPHHTITGNKTLNSFIYIWSELILLAGGKVYFRVNGELNPVSTKKPLGDEFVKKETDGSGENLSPLKLQGWPKGWKTLIHGMK